MTTEKSEGLHRTLGIITTILTTVLTVLLGIGVTKLESVELNQELILRKMSAYDEWYRQNTPRFDQVEKDIRTATTTNAVQDAEISALQSKVNTR